MHGGNSLTVNVIGAGNLGFHLAKALGDAANVKVNAVFSRDLKNALAASAYCEAKAFDKLEGLPEADLFVIAVKDDAIRETADKIARLDLSKKPLVVHTAGVIPTSILSENFDRFGSFYPLQTFTKTKDVKWNKIPICIHATSDADLSLLEAISARLSKSVYVLDDRQREQLHLSAVFANNFVNHIWNLTFDFCNENKINPRILYPLIEQTTAKALDLGPEKAQTGPAKRGDQASIDRHIKLLEDSASLKNIYEMLTDSIQSFKTKSNEL